MEQIIKPSIASKEDKRLADLLCKKDLDATASFQEIHSKRLLFISSKLCNVNFNDEEAYDDIMNTYRWIVGQVQIKSCLFKALSKFENYIFSVLNSSWLRKDWLKWKTGVTGYIPKSITKMGSKHISVYKLMHQKKDEITIEEKLGIHYVELRNIMDDIYEFLYKSGKQDLVEDYKVSSLTVLKDGEEVSYEPPDRGMSVEDQDLLSMGMGQIDDIMESTFNPSQRKIAIAYWGHGFSADLLYKGLKKDAPGILEKSNIKSAEDVYKFVTNFINDFHKEIQKLNNLITNKGARTIIENYFLIKK